MARRIWMTQTTQVTPFDPRALAPVFPIFFMEHLKSPAKGRHDSDVASVQEHQQLVQQQQQLLAQQGTLDLGHPTEQ